MDWITIKESCQLLGVSRPTFDSYRKKLRLRSVRFGGRLHFSKSEIIGKLILPIPSEGPNLSLTIFCDFALREIVPIPGVYDLRKIAAIDAYGVMALLCSIKAHLNQNAKNTAHLLLDGSPFCSYLQTIGFFTEVERAHRDRVHCNYSDIRNHPQSRTAVILPLHLIGYRGAEKKIIEELYDPLFRQGFSEAYCGYIGWIVGELCDNAHTHSEGPCYLIIEALELASTEKRFLCIAVGDTGIGIPASLRKNPRYSGRQAKALFPMAFMSEVSRMEVEPKRGKGLNDIVGISKGNHSWLRVEADDMAMFFDFRNGKDEIKFAPPVIRTPGTRFCMVLIDSDFNGVPRSAVDEVMRKFMENS